jgi:hypothetical protein
LRQYGDVVFDHIQLEPSTDENIPFSGNYWSLNTMLKELPRKVDFPEKSTYPISDKMPLEDISTDLSTYGTASVESPLQRPLDMASPASLDTSYETPTPFSCPVPNCHKIYARKGDLKYHVLNKHPQYSYLSTEIARPKSEKEGKEFPCPVAWCNCGYRWQRDLRRHYKAKHEPAAPEAPSARKRKPSPRKDSRVRSKRRNEALDWKWVDCNVEIESFYGDQNADRTKWRWTDCTNFCLST